MKLVNYVVMNANENVNDVCLRMQIMSTEKQKQQRQEKFMYGESGRGMYGGMYEKDRTLRLSLQS